jgi:hypothetical protein
MDSEPDWKARAVAAEYGLAALLLAGSFIAGLIGAIRSLLG